MTGPVALHGGGEFLPGDERVLGAMLDLAPVRDGPIRVAIVPTAAARGRPDIAGAHGVRAFERVASAVGRTVTAEVVAVLEAASAADEGLARRLREADVIHLPGGDPDLIPTIYPGTAAWAAIRDANERGAVVAGASAGAMALGGWTWTPRGGLDGLGLVPRVIVVPHADAASWDRAVERFGRMVPSGMDALGLAERTAVIVMPAGPWRVVGEGEVRWLPVGADGPQVLRDGDTFERRADAQGRVADAE